MATAFRHPSFLWQSEPSVARTRYDHPSGQPWDRFPPAFSEDSPWRTASPAGLGAYARPSGCRPRRRTGSRWAMVLLEPLCRRLVGGLLRLYCGWIVVAVWVLSGAVDFLRPVEEMIARYLLRLRLPTLVERQRLGPGWYQLAHRAGVDPDRFTIWVQESDDVNATPTPGHTVAVTRWALYTVPAQHLEAVLAHEVSHHLGGRAWLSLLSFWYSIPARVTLIAVRALGRQMRKVPALGCAVAAFLLHGIRGARAGCGDLRARPTLAIPVPDTFCCAADPCVAQSMAVKQADRKAAQLATVLRWCRSCTAGRSRHQRQPWAAR